MTSFLNFMVDLRIQNVTSELFFANVIIIIIFYYLCIFIFHFTQNPPHPPNPNPPPGLPLSKACFGLFSCTIRQGETADR